MISQYLKTKLDIPATRQQFLRRKRTLQLLDNSVDNKAILVSAPAGYGKTSAISDWAKTRREPFAWISLDESDNDPIRFLGYLQSALSEIDPDLVISESHFSTYSSLSSATFLTILLNPLADNNSTVKSSLLICRIYLQSCS